MTEKLINKQNVFIFTQKHHHKVKYDLVFINQGIFSVTNQVFKFFFLLMTLSSMPEPRILLLYMPVKSLDLNLFSWRKLSGISYPNGEVYWHFSVCLL